jgi:threonine synthase
MRELWGKVDTGGAFDLSQTRHFAGIDEYGFVSGSSTHADRLATIRRIWEQYAVMIDTHTADGIKVGMEHSTPGIPLICLETALPIKFEDTIREALQREPERPSGMDGIGDLPQHFSVMAVDDQAVKNYIAAHAG